MVVPRGSFFDSLRPVALSCGLTMFSTETFPAIVPLSLSNSFECTHCVVRVDEDVVSVHLFLYRGRSVPIGSAALTSDAPNDACCEELYLLSYGMSTPLELFFDLFRFLVLQSWFFAGRSVTSFLTSVSGGDFSTFRNL